MSYQGRTPTPSPLTSSDITDGIITTSKIADANITNPKLTTGSQQNFRNLIINGDISVAQRSTSATNISSSGYHAIDRFRFGFTDTDQLVATISQDTDVPSGQGFSKSMKFLVTTVESALDANDALQIQYRMEGQNCQNLKYGTSSAESLTLSFWVKSSVTGTYALTFKNSESGGTKLNVNTYAISSANTWEKKIISITGDTSSSIDNTNTNELELLWGLTAGSNYKGTSSSGWTSYSASKLFNGQTADIATTSNANFYLTGVQLEVGTTASDFEFIPFDVNLQRCKRYYESFGTFGDYLIGYGYGSGSDTARTSFPFTVEKRVTPTMADVSSSRQVRINWTSSDGTAVNQNSTTQATFSEPNIKNSGYVQIGGYSSIGGGQHGYCRMNNATTTYEADAEL